MSSIKGKLHYADYLHGEYGDLDSDYMFVNLWGGSYGRPLTYASVYDLVLRLRRDTGIDFDPHWLRHTRATLSSTPTTSPAPTSDYPGRWPST
ncbi:hypothetical protein ACFW2X_28305 [Streptomyces antibioticus]|uniref:hypothetical protein n=1 Tax=Streptomyces antibioticus TaxID=1890 RepID=UPI003693E660